MEERAFEQAFFQRSIPTMFIHQYGCWGEHDDITGFNLAQSCQKLIGAEMF